MTNFIRIIQAASATYLLVIIALALIVVIRAQFGWRPAKDTKLDTKGMLFVFLASLVCALTTATSVDF